MAIGVQIVFDCAEPNKLAGFWAEALHYETDAASVIVDPDGTGPPHLLPAGAGKGEYQEPGPSGPEDWGRAWHASG